MEKGVVSVWRGFMVFRDGSYVFHFMTLIWLNIYLQNEGCFITFDFHFGFLPILLIAFLIVFHFILIAYPREMYIEFNTNVHKNVWKQLFFFHFQVKWQEESAIKIWFWEGCWKRWFWEGGWKKCQRRGFQTVRLTRTGWRKNKGGGGGLWPSKKLWRCTQSICDPQGISYYINQNGRTYNNQHLLRSSSNGSKTNVWDNC